MQKKIVMNFFGDGKEHDVCGFGSFGTRGKKKKPK